MVIPRLSSFPLKYYGKKSQRWRKFWIGSGLGLWCLMPLSTVFQLYCGGGGNQSTQRKPTTCRKSDKLYNIILYWFLNDMLNNRSWNVKRIYFHEIVWLRCLFHPHFSYHISPSKNEPEKHLIRLWINDIEV